MSAVGNKIALALGSVLFLTWFAWFPANTNSFASKTGPRVVESMPNLDGDKAKNFLDNQGLSESLGEALKTARYGATWVERSPLSNRSGAYEARNPQQRFAAYFSNGGVDLVSREPGEEWTLSLKLSLYGDAEQSVTMHRAQNWSADKTKISAAHEIESQVTKQRSKITEVFENKPDGLEQTFIIQEKIDHEPLKLVLSIQGDLFPEVSADGQTLIFKRPGRDTVLQYDKLKSWDATGSELTSTMQLNGSELSLTVDDEGAVYPVTVDPTFTQVKKLLASDGQTGDFFGTSLALSGDTAIVGAFGNNSLQGSAYIFQRNAGGANNWSEVKKLTASDGGTNDLFGVAVTIQGDTAIVGASGEFPDDQGSVYIFERNAGGTNNWGEVKKILPTDGATFGSSMSLDHNTLVVGAEGFFNGETGEQGAAYIFDRDNGGTNNWGLVKRIEAEDGDVGDFFGAASCINGKTVFIGNGRNRAYVFERNADGFENWGQTRMLTSPHGSLDVAFAGSISMDSETAVLGAPNDFEDENDDGQGAAYILGRNVGGENNWGLIKRIVASDGAPVEHFGSSVAMSGDRVVVGSAADDIGANANQGSAYVFERNSGGADNWGQVNKIVATGGVAQDRFGSFIALDGNTMIAGAPGLNLDGNTTRGAAFVFVRSNNTWTEEAHPLPVNCTVLAFFGFSIAISGDTAVAGAPWDDAGLNSNQGAAYIFERTGSSWNLIKTVTASDGVSEDLFGVSVEISGDTVVVGAYSKDAGPAVDQGAAYVFERNIGGANNWGQVKKLTAADGEGGDWFGRSVAISNNTIVVAAMQNDINANNVQGSAYIYERNAGGANNWGQVKELVASDGAAFDRFGASVTIDGNTAVVGADLDDIGGNGNRGSAYVFERNNGGANNWGELRKLTASDGSTGDQFGISVAADSDTLIVGAFTDDVGTNNNQGSAYIFERNTGGANNWGQVKKLLATDGSAANYFGGSVDISGDAAIIGSSNDQIGANEFQGSAYIFRQNVGGTNNWGEVRKLTAPDGEALDQFGVDVSISGDTAIVGSLGDDLTGASNQGSARVFVNGGGTWNQQALLAPPPPINCGTDDNYGYAVAIDGDTAVISATADDVGVNTNQGTVYVLERNLGGAGNWGLVAILSPLDGGSNDIFGSSVAIDGDTVIVGASNKTIGANAGQGAAYIFSRNSGGPNNFGEVKKILAPDGQALDIFGWSVGISGDTAVIGAYFGADIRPGAAYIFRQNLGGADNWGHVKKLTASDGATGNSFGWSVSISGDSVVVGARSANVGANNVQGSAYVFERNSGGTNNWGELRKLTAADGALGDHFGTSVSIDGNRLVVGANTDDIGANADQGSAYIFERNTGGANNWGQVRKLVDATGETFGYFGYSAGISGDTVIVGSPFDNVGQNQAQGSALVFTQNAGGADNWGLATRLTATDGSANDTFGTAVAVSGDNFLVGAYQADFPTPFGKKQTDHKSSAGNQEGSSYIFVGSALAPTAANVSVSGRVANAAGGGIGRVAVSLTDGQGNIRTTFSSSFGHFSFENVPAGQTYVISVAHKRYVFNPNSRVLRVVDELTNVDFAADGK